MLQMGKMLVLRKLNPFNVQKETRTLWWWTVHMFNRMDAERTKALGHDRTAAEWLLRNGACAKFVGFPNLLCDYNLLPPENQKFLIKEIEAIGAGINDEGFLHLTGCENLEKLVLKNCSYITDDALHRLAHCKGSLKVLEIFGCKNITDEGLRSLSSMEKLEKLVVRDLPYIKDVPKITEELKKSLKNCEIDIK